MDKSITPGPDTARDFRAALGRFATGVTVITTRDATGPLGITANSFASLSIDPPLVLWSPARSSKRFTSFVEARHFAIHVMAADQYDLCANFARDGRTFDGFDVGEGAGGTPLLDCLARFDCTAHAVHEGGDHAIVVGRVVSASWREGTPLLFYNGIYAEAPE
ncbi:flavin reductase [Mesobaculum littorinae]|uniref:Flavin reductase n=1 Tax=Mesobaculum littorinae TaxID=2486419 RepID=A0A438AK79_9RHOB|nr:flavin reductase [Mesobaculum littorinae]